MSPLSPKPYKKMNKKLRVWIALEIILLTATHIFYSQNAFTFQNICILSLTFFLAALLLWIAILSEMELSLAVPIFGLNLIVFPLMDFLIEGIPLEKEYGIGVILVICGVILLENPYAEKGVKKP